MKKIDKALGLFDKFATGSIKEKAADYSVSETVDLIQSENIQYGINILLQKIETEINKKLNENKRFINEKHVDQDFFKNNKMLEKLVYHHLYQRIATVISDCYDLVKKAEKEG